MGPFLLPTFLNASLTRRVSVTSRSVSLNSTLHPLCSQGASQPAAPSLAARRVRVGPGELLSYWWARFCANSSWSEKVKTRLTGRQYRPKPIIDLGIPARLFVARSTPSGPRPDLLAAPARLALPLGRPTDRQGPPRPRARTNAHTPGGPLYRRTRQLPQGHARCFRAPLLLPPPKAMASAALMMALDPVADAAAEGGALRAAKGAALAAALPLPAGHTPKEVCAPRATCKGARALAREGGLREHGLGSRVVCGRGGGGGRGIRAAYAAVVPPREATRRKGAPAPIFKLREVCARPARRRRETKRALWQRNGAPAPISRPRRGRWAGIARGAPPRGLPSLCCPITRSPHDHLITPPKKEGAMWRDRRAKRARGW